MALALAPVGAPAADEMRTSWHSALARPRGPRSASGRARDRSSSPRPTRPARRCRNRTFRAAPDDLARLGFAVAHAIDAEAPAGPELRQSCSACAPDCRRSGACRAAAGRLGHQLRSEAVIEAAAQVAWALCERQAGQLSFTLAERIVGLALTAAAAPLSERLSVQRQHARNRHRSRKRSLSGARRARR